MAAQSPFCCGCASLLLVLGFIALACAQVQMQAQCILQPTVEYGKPLNVKGHVNFSLTMPGAPVTVSVYITGNLNNGEYALSINEAGDLTDLETGSSVGYRFQGRGNNTFACPPVRDRKAGDLANWSATNGVINSTGQLDLLEMIGENSIIGLSLVLHDKPDNCSSSLETPSNKLAVCVIGITNVDNNAVANYNTAATSAVAVLQPTSNCNASCTGTVWLSIAQNAPGSVTVIAQVAGLKVGSAHGFHIHQYGDMSAADGTSAGAHWNPNGRNHALPNTIPRHTGDLGNIQSYDSQGFGWYNYTDSNIPDIYSLLGRAVVVHAEIDHGAGAGCDQAGTSGKRVMIGVIGKMNLATVVADVPIAVNNTYVNIACITSPVPVQGNNTDTSGLEAGLAIGWVLVGLLGFCVIPSMIAFYWLKLRPAVAGDFYRQM